MKKVQLSIFVLVLFLAALLRFYNFTSNPPALYWDDVSIGYNAYSIVQTGKDEWGVSYPAVFKSFGDYKLPLYVYLASITVKIFGPNEVGVRLPSLLAGIATVALTYFLLQHYATPPALAHQSNKLLAHEQHRLMRQHIFGP